MNLDLNAFLIQKSDWLYRSTFASLEYLASHLLWACYFRLAFSDRGLWSLLPMLLYHLLRGTCGTPARLHRLTRRFGNPSQIFCTRRRIFDSSTTFCGPLRNTNRTSRSHNTRRQCNRRTRGQSTPIPPICLQGRSSSRKKLRPPTLPLLR